MADRKRDGVSWYWADATTFWRMIIQGYLQTGQTTCHGTLGRKIPCFATGQDGEFRKGLPWPTPRFVQKDETVIDRLTGLAWTQINNKKMDSKGAPMSITQPALPYGKDALSPYISQQTIEFHYGKHHSAYIANANKLIEGTEFSNQDLEAIIKKSSKEPSLSAIFNNAAQAWNHSFYWSCMKPGGGGPPSGTIAKKISADFGSYGKFAEEFKNAGVTQFGSGWAWLVIKDDHLEITKTSNADTPLAHGLKPILTVDVWEHAYYLDYQNKRPDYLSTFVEHLINWDFVNSLIG